MSRDYSIGASVRCRAQSAEKLSWINRGIIVATYAAAASAWILACGGMILNNEVASDFCALRAQNQKQ